MRISNGGKRYAMVQRRTFEAAYFPQGSEQRRLYNLLAVSSEYHPSHRWAVDCLTESVRGWRSTQTTKTKHEAVALADAWIARKVAL